MARWNLSPQYKKSAVERQYWYKDGKTIIREEGFRWANFKVDSVEKPLTEEELKNEDGYELGCIDNDECWEMWDMMDGCWADLEKGRNCTDEDLEEFETAWDEDGYSGVEEAGWSNDETEYWYFGPLELTNDDTGEVFQGEPDENVSVSGVPTAPIEVLEDALKELEEAIEFDDDPQADCPHCKWEGPMGEVKFIDGKFYCPACEKPFGTREERDAMLAKEEIKEFVEGYGDFVENMSDEEWEDFGKEEKPIYTEWYPVSINPVRNGTYQVLHEEMQVSWPFESNVKSAEWDGKKWNDKKVVKWRGLTDDPNI